MQQMEIHEYVNERRHPAQKHGGNGHQTGRRLSQIVFLSFGVLCIIQASLNISLRLTMNLGSESQIINRTLLEEQGGNKEVQDCKHRGNDEFNKLQDRLNALTSDKNLLENRNNELNNEVKNLQEEINRLQMQLRGERQVQNKFNKLQQRFNELTSDKNLLENRNNELNNVVKNLQEEINRLKKELRDETQIQNEFNKLQDRFNALTGDKNLLENRNNELNSTIRNLREEIIRLQMQLRDQCSCPQCPAGWREINSKCYFLSTEGKTWQDSRKYCQSQQADLVVIDSEEEQRALYQLDGDDSLLFWIGLHVRNRVFEWVDGSALSQTFWQSGQPDQGGPNNREDCVEMYHRSPVLANWNDAPCGHMLRWLCEKAQHTC